MPEKPSLKTGLLALKQKDYLEAIAHLQIIAKQESLNPKLKAQMGLIIAYEKTQQVDRAIYFCRNLTKISDSEIKSFANHHLKKLLKQYPPKNLKKSTIPTPKSLEKSSENQQLIETGFVPFNHNSDQSKSAKNSNEISKQKIDLSVETGFKPIAENPNISEKKSSQTLNYLKHSKLNKNDIEAEKNRTLALSSIVNKSNLKNTNQSHQIPREIISDEPENLPKLKWREAGRTKGSRRLKSPNLTLLWLEQIVVVIALFWLSLTILKFSLDATNDFLVWLPYFRPIQIFYRDPTRNFIIFMLGLFIFSPWLIDGLLILTYGLQTLPTTTLINYLSLIHI